MLALEKRVSPCVGGLNDITRGLPDHEGRGVDGRPEYARIACERSLKRLQVETLDIYYYHYALFYYSFWFWSLFKIFKEHL